MTDDALDGILRATRAVLLDFDGPVTPLLPAGANRLVASAAREPLYRFGMPLPPSIASTTDHLAVLRYAAESASPGLVNAVELMCTTGETISARSCEPTPGAHDALRAMYEAKRPVVIVTNNAAGAVQMYLRRHRLDSFVQAITGRVLSRPELMKPHPDVIGRALHVLQAKPDDCLMIGDSVTDIEVSRLTGVHAVGYAKTAHRGEELAEAGAEVVVPDMASIAAAIRRCGPLPD